MGEFRSSKISAVIAAAVVLACQTAGAHAASEHWHLRHRNLQTDDDSTWTTSSRNYKRLGCFKDREEDRILGHKLTDDKNVKADFCYDYCVSLGAPLMATQYSIECWCATEVEVEFDRHGGAECDYPCAGDQEEMCGGPYAFTLYLIGTTGRDDGDGYKVTSSPAPTPPPVPPTPSPDAPPSNPDFFVDDIVKTVDCDGANPGGAGWADSYSIDGKCFMHTTFDHDIGGFEVNTPIGKMTIRDLYEKMGPGPGAEGRPLYNDIQCGNGPPNTAPDEVTCPGLVEYGRDGCEQVGPMWDLSGLGE